MDRLETGLRVSALLLMMASFPARASITLYNTSLTCLKGSDVSNDFEIDCYNKDPSAFLVVHRVIHGLTPRANGCSVSSPKATCCPDPPDPARDCVFSSEEGVAELKKKCDGLLTCYTKLSRVRVAGACPDTDDGLTYGSYSDFARVEYSCINTDLMSDVCSENSTLAGEELFLETNFFHNNHHRASKTCSCAITTSCQHTLVFEVLQLDLAKDDSGACTESVVLTEGGSGEVLTSLNCSASRLAHLFRSGGGGGGGVFYTQTNVASLDLLLLANNTGTLLMRVTATGGAPLEVLCGQPASQAPDHQTLCSSTMPTTPTISTNRPSPGTEDLSSPTYNTSKEACLRGQGISQDFEISCLNKGTVGLISVERIFHALTPDSMGCGILSPKANCCPGLDPARDCVFPSLEGLAELRKKCDGAEVCQPTLGRATVGDACPPREGGNVTYGAYSYFAFVQYSCINTGLMSDVCHAGSTVRNSEVYMETNVYHSNDEQFNTTCSCVVSTMCGHRLLFHPLELQLASGDKDTCVEQVTIVDGGNASVSATLNCSSNNLDEVYRNGGGEAVFISQNNVVNFRLELQSHNTGKLLLRVTASGGVSVEVRCGRTTALDLWDQHQCATAATTPVPTTLPPPTTIVTSTTTTSTTTSPKTSDSSGGAFTGDGDARSRTLDTGVAAAIGVFAFLILAVIIVLVIIIWKSRKLARSESPASEYTVQYVSRALVEDDDGYEHPYDLPINDQDGLEKRPYEGLSSVSASNPPARGSGVYETHVHNTDEELEGAVGGLINPAYDLENELNWSKTEVKEF